MTSIPLFQVQPVFPYFLQKTTKGTLVVFRREFRIDNGMPVSSNKNGNTHKSIKIPLRAALALLNGACRSGLL
jgi:hypothetical protein